MGEQDRRLIVRVLGALSLASLLGLLLLTISPSELSQAAAPNLPGQILSGTARVIDGDTLDLAGTRVRLEGIDAPESGQRCHSVDHGTWACGLAATRTLSGLVAGENVSCEGLEVDRYGRVIAICRVGSLELNAEMVRRGMAWAFVRYSQRLVAVETEARRQSLGIWEAHNEAPWVFRARSWSYAQAGSDSNCAIKGNISSSGRIYHLPWSPHYNEVRIGVSRGERWFCSEDEAVAAGWRPAATN